MKGLLLVIALVLLGCAIKLDKAVRPPTAQELICEYTQWEGCMDVPAPVLVVTKNMPPYARGLYVPDEPYIFVSAYASDSIQFEVEVHETVHYLQVKLGLLGSTPYGRDMHCKTENDARALTALILGTEYDHTWRARYGCQKG